MTAAARGATPTMPPELTAALELNPAAKAYFEQMPPSHRQEHVKHVAEAARQETRRRRAEAMIPLVLKWGDERTEKLNPEKQSAGT